VGWRLRTTRQGPTYLRMLAGIVIYYALIIVLGDSATAGVGRVVLLGYLLWNSVRLRGRPRLRIWVWVTSALLVAVVAGLNVAGQVRAASAFVGALSFLIICLVIAAIAWTLRALGRVDLETVLGVLCIYLLLALLFASLNQFFVVFDAHYLHGVSGTPTASDLLYFSVITIATVGYGDIAPASDLARAVSVVEALAGQLYLVSVVAAVVGGWRAGSSPDDPS
jgi:hypothetical protein